MRAELLGRFSVGLSTPEFERRRRHHGRLEHSTRRQRSAHRQQELPRNLFNGMQVGLHENRLWRPGSAGQQGWPWASPISYQHRWFDRFPPRVGTIAAGPTQQRHDIGRFTSKRFGVVPESASSWATTSRITARFAGYDFLFWSNVVRRGTDRHERIADFRPRFRPRAGGGACAGSVVNTNTYWAQERFVWRCIVTNLLLGFTTRSLPHVAGLPRRTFLSHTGERISCSCRVRHAFAATRKGCTRRRGQFRSTLDLPPNSSAKSV